MRYLICMPFSVLFVFNSLAQDVTFAVGKNQVLDASIIGTNFQWMIDSGTGLKPLINNAIFSGVQTKLLTVKAPKTSWAGYRFQAKIDSTTGALFTLRYQTTFTASYSPFWEDPRNWVDGNMPDQYADVVVVSGKAEV